MLMQATPRGADQALTPRAAAALRSGQQRSAAASLDSHSSSGNAGREVQPELEGLEADDHLLQCGPSHQTEVDGQEEGFADGGGKRAREGREHGAQRRRRAGGYAGTCSTCVVVWVL